MLQCTNISKRYNKRKVLKNITIQFPETGLVSIVGPSGCGKTTLLHILGGIKKEYSGSVLYHDHDIRHKHTRYKKYVSFIFQDIYLIMWLNIQKNISISRYFYNGYFHIEVLKNDLKTAKIAHMSLGQRQKISYLRAAYTNSKILLCDEPTGSLDPLNANKLMKELKQLSEQRLVIMVSHDHELVKTYSDEIYEMKDGEIINHEIISHKEYNEIKEEKHYKYPLSLIKLTLHSIKTHITHYISMISGLSLTLFAIMLTLTLTLSLKQELYDYIYSYIPPSCISFKTKNYSSIDESVCSLIEEYNDVERIQLYLDNYELLGISFNKERYKENESLFISSDSDPYNDISLKEGRYPLENNEIILSLSTAKKLNNNINELINKKIYAYYKRELKVIPIEYTIVGITQNNTTYDTYYQKENAYISLLKENYPNNDYNTSLGIIYINQLSDRDIIYNNLIKTYKDYEFIKVGESTFNYISDIIQRIEYILISISTLSLLSSLLLIGEIMYLNLSLHKKDYMIMKCFGASHIEIIMILFIEIFIIFISSLLFSSLSCISLLKLLEYLSEIYLFNSIELLLSKDTVFKTILIGITIILLSVFPSLKSLNNIDSKVLKE